MSWAQCATRADLDRRSAEMKRIHIIFGPLLVLATAFLAACASSNMDGHLVPDPELVQRVASVVDPLVAANKFSGAIVLMQHGQTVYRRGFGIANHAAGIPFTPDTPSDGGSLAKLFTAAGIWWLADEGRIDLDAPVTRYISEYPHAQTTVRHLIAHSNGLPPGYDFFDPFFAADEVRTTPGLLRVVALHASKPSFSPGSRFEYSSLGFDVAALLIERVAGQSYEAFVKERFFTPLGMQSSLGRPARLADWPGVRTMGYRWHDGVWTEYDVFDMEAFLGGSNIYFSAADLAQWGSAHALGTALPAAIVERGQKAIGIGGGHSGITGLSWYGDDLRDQCHYPGVINAFCSVVYWDRVRKESVAFVSNSTLPPWTFIGLQRALVDALAARPTEAEDSITFEQFDQTTRSAVAGAYGAQGLGLITISASPNGLLFRVGADLEYGMFPASKDVFYVPGLDYWVAFSGGHPPPTIHIKSMTQNVVGRRR